MIESVDDIYFIAFVVSPFILIGFVVICVMKRCLRTREPVEEPNKNEVRTDNPPQFTPQFTQYQQCQQYPQIHSNPSTRIVMESNGYPQHPHYAPYHMPMIHPYSHHFDTLQNDGALQNVARAIAQSAQNIFLNSITDSMVALSPISTNASMLRRRSLTERRMSLRF